MRLLVRTYNRAGRIRMTNVIALGEGLIRGSPRTTDNEPQQGTAFCGPAFPSHTRSTVQPAFGPMANKPTIPAIVEKLNVHHFACKEEEGDPGGLDLPLAVQVSHHRRGVTVARSSVTGHGLFDACLIIGGKLQVQCAQGFLQSVPATRTDQGYDVFAA